LRFYFIAHAVQIEKVEFVMGVFVFADEIADFIWVSPMNFSAAALGNTQTPPVRASIFSSGIQNV